MWSSRAQGPPLLACFQKSGSLLPPNAPSSRWFYRLLVPKHVSVEPGRGESWVCSAGPLLQAVPLRCPLPDT